jgi:hypothetical protein
MEQRTYTQVWQLLTPEQKITLSERADCSYDYLKCVAHRKGRCGRHLARIIATELLGMSVITGSVDDQVSTLFPPAPHRASSPAPRTIPQETPAA